MSESQYGMALHEEMRQIRSACEKYDKTLRSQQKSFFLNPKKDVWIPKITIIVVTKRHHARFYPKQDAYPPDIGTKEDKNLSAGTVVDTDVVTPNHWSFYLQSHASGLGTARSAHHIVLRDEAGYTPTELQKIVSSKNTPILLHRNMNQHGA